MGLNLDCSQWVRSGSITRADEADRHWGFWATYTLVKPNYYTRLKSPTKFDCQDIWWSLYVGREFSINISHGATISLPTVEGLPRWRLGGNEENEPTAVIQTFIESCKLSVMATKIMDVL